MNLPFSFRRSRVYAFLALCCLLSLAIGWRSRFEFMFVSGTSMQPTLFHGDLLVLDHTAYYEGVPKRGDVVVARYDADFIVKRVVGLPGEVIEVDRGRLLINGQIQTLDHAIEPGWLTIGRGLLFEDRYALLGDNRSVFAGEAVFAVVPGSEILGRVVFSIRGR